MRQADRDMAVQYIRSMLGKGGNDNNSLVLTCDKAGIRGDYDNFAAPRSMAPYRSGLLYFHGGASLPESVVPVLVVKLESVSQPDVRHFSVELTYKEGAKRITTRRPVVEVIPWAEGLFSHHTDFEIILEAQDVKGKTVGEAKPGGAVNPATRSITLKSGFTGRSLLMNFRFEHRNDRSIRLTTTPSCQTADCRPPPRLSLKTGPATGCRISHASPCQKPRVDGIESPDYDQNHLTCHH
ncbi:MAG: hypothetical protein AB7S77_21430 [Desulfatirhabdiaceae bacterium]